MFTNNVWALPKMTISNPTITHNEGNSGCVNYNFVLKLDRLSVHGEPTPRIQYRIVEQQSYNNSNGGTITINSSPWLQHNNQYDIKMKTTSTLSGIDKTSNLINTTKRIKQNRKMS